MRLRLFGAVLPACLAIGCAAAGGTLGQNNSAELVFAKQSSPGGLPGRFTKLDGRAIPGQPAILRVPTGKHTIEYNCPDVLTMDSYPTVRAEFAAGQSYILECDANAPGVVKAR